MKESNFYSDDFEELIREKTEQYKMYPSDKVWKGVHNSLHTKRKWFIGSMSLLVTGILFMAGKELIAPAHPSIARKIGIPDSSALPDNARANAFDNPHNTVLIAAHGNDYASGNRHAAESGDETSPEEDPAFSNISISVSHPVISLPNVSELLKQLGPLSEQAPSLPVIASRNNSPEAETGDVTADHSNVWTTRDVASIKDGGAQPLYFQIGDGLTIKDMPRTTLTTSALLEGAAAREAMQTGNASKETGREVTGRESLTLTTSAASKEKENLFTKDVASRDGNASRDAATAKAVPSHESVAAKTIAPNGSSHAATENIDDITARYVLNSLSERGVWQAKLSYGKRQAKPYAIINEDRIPDSASGIARLSAAAMAESEDRQHINWLHEYAMYTLPVSEPKPRTFLQLTIAPTINYRKLSGGDFTPSKNIPSGPVAFLHPGDAQRYVDHSPALGFEVGGNLVYRVTRNFSIKGGLQFNFSRYTIKAYNSPGSQEATINLSSYGRYVMDSITSYTRVGNFGGESQVTLNNDYYQLSAPIGFELRLLGNERLTINVGATIQPSYLLNTNTYMLSSDYTSYTKEPSLLRRFNWNAGIEAFLSYRIRPGLYWQIGPEFRYQLHSSYVSEYPVNENLKGYGIKFGIVKSLP